MLITYVSNWDYTCLLFHWCYWRWPHSMQSGVYAAVMRPSVRLSVRPIRGRHTPLLRVCCCGPATRRYRSIAAPPSGRRSAAAAPQQHGAQQQMRERVPYCQWRRKLTTHFFIARHALHCIAILVCVLAIICLFLILHVVSHYFKLFVLYTMTLRQSCDKS